MSALHCWRKRNQASGIDPTARKTTRRSSRRDPGRRACHAVAISASHSARNSRRAHPGASRETSAMKRRTKSGMTRARPEAAEILEPLHRHVERLGAGPGDLVVAARGTLLAARDFLALPARSHEPERLETPERGIHG